MKEKINSLQFASIFALTIISSSIGLSLFTTIKIAGIDSYISIIIGAILGIIPFLIFLYLFNYEPDKPIFEKNTLLFGKVLGNIINIIIALIYFVIGGTIIFNFGNFIVSQYLSEVPLIFILIILGLISLYAVNKGFEVISRISSISLVIVIIFFLIGCIFLFSEIKIDNLKPILEFGLKKPLLAGFINMLISLSPIYTLLLFPKNNITDKSKVAKYLTFGYIYSAINIFFISFISNSILGKYLVKLYQYPGYISLKRISIFGFIDRIENFLSFHWILSSFITITVIIYYLKNSLNRKKPRNITGILITILLIYLSYRTFNNNTTFNNYTYHYYPYILASLFFIHIIIFITALIKKKIKKK